MRAAIKTPVMDYAEYCELTGKELARMREALNWYAEHAKMMQRAALQVDNQVALHILKELAVDGGKRAQEAMK